MRVSWLFLLCGCPQTPAPVQPTAPPSVVDASAPDVAPVVAAEASAPIPTMQAVKCTEPAIQPGTCVPANGDMNEEAIAEWLKRHGSLEDVSYEACRETPFGSEPALACTRVGHVAIDKALGIAGPVEFRREFVLVTVRGKKRVELVVLPLDFGVGDKVTFTARFNVDKTGTVDLVLGPQECSDAKKELNGWIENEIKQLRDNDGIEPAFKKQLVAATNLEKTSDLARIDVICKAAGHYVLGPKGTVVLAR